MEVKICESFSEEKFHNPEPNFPLPNPKPRSLGVANRVCSKMTHNCFPKEVLTHRQLHSVRKFFIPSLFLFSLSLVILSFSLSVILLFHYLFLGLFLFLYLTVYFVHLYPSQLFDYFYSFMHSLPLAIPLFFKIYHALPKSSV